MKVLRTMYPQMVIYSLTHYGAYFHLWKCSELQPYTIIGDNFLTLVLVLKAYNAFLLMHKQEVRAKQVGGTILTTIVSHLFLSSCCPPTQNWHHFALAVLWCDGLGRGKRQKHACLTSTLRSPLYINTHRKHAATYSYFLYIHTYSAQSWCLPRVLRLHTHCLNFKVPSPASFLWHGACYTFYFDI